MRVIETYAPSVLGWLLAHKRHFIIVLLAILLSILFRMLQ